MFIPVLNTLGPHFIVPASRLKYTGFHNKTSCFVQTLHPFFRFSGALLDGPQARREDAPQPRVLDVCGAGNPGVGGPLGTACNGRSAAAPEPRIATARGPGQGPVHAHAVAQAIHERYAGQRNEIVSDNIINFWCIDIIHIIEQFLWGRKHERRY